MTGLVGYVSFHIHMGTRLVYIYIALNFALYPLTFLNKTLGKHILLPLSWAGLDVCPKIRRL